ARPRLRTGSVRELRVRAPRAVLVQATRLLSQLWRAAHGGAGRPPRRSRPAARSPAPVGAHPAAPPALSSCVQSCALPRGARRRRSGRARLLAPPRGAHGRARRAERRRDGDPALRGRPPTERPLPHPPLGRRLRRGRRREPRVPRRRAPERRGGGAAARHHLPARPASPRAPRTRRRCPPPDVDPLAEESPALAGIRSASIQGRIALGPRTGARVLQLGREPEPPWVTSRG